MLHACIYLSITINYKSRVEWITCKDRMGKFFVFICFSFSFIKIVLKPSVYFCYWMYIFWINFFILCWGFFTIQYLTHVYLLHIFYVTTFTFVNNFLFWRKVIQNIYHHFISDFKYFAFVLNWQPRIVW